MEIFLLRLHQETAQIHREELDVESGSGDFSPSSSACFMASKWRVSLSFQVEVNMVGIAGHSHRSHYITISLQYSLRILEGQGISCNSSGFDNLNLKDLVCCTLLLMNPVQSSQQRIHPGNFTLFSGADYVADSLISNFDRCSMSSIGLCPST